MFSFNSTTTTLEPLHYLTPDRVGEYPITIILQDDNKHPRSSIWFFTIVVKERIWEDEIEEPE